MQKISLFLIFMTGLSGGFHCAGMCGGFISAFTFNIPNNSKKLQLILFLNIGRIFSYCLIGFILGGLSKISTILENTQIFRNILFLLSNIILFILGLYFSDISSFIVKIEKIGVPIWKRLNSLLNKLLPIDSIVKSFFFGMIWGWVPCGLVYSVSIYAFLSNNPFNGLLIMLCFGLGTLPNLLSMGYFTSILSDFMKKKVFRLFIGIFLMLFSAYNIIKFYLI